MDLTALHFWRMLGQEAQQAMLICKRMKDTGETLARASWHLTGRSWSGARLTGGLARVTKLMVEIGVRNAVAETMIAEGTAAAAAAGGGAAAGGAAAGGTAAGLSAGTIIAGLAVAIGIAAGVYVLSGQIGKMSADSSVKAGEKGGRVPDEIKSIMELHGAAFLAPGKVTPGKYYVRWSDGHGTLYGPHDDKYFMVSQSEETGGKWLEPDGSGGTFSYFGTTVASFNTREEAATKAELLNKYLESRPTLKKEILDHRVVR